jgi:[protein-PII] uridylyltransferase
MEVTAQDRPGLLYRVALALRDCHINLVAAKVSTYGERAEDIFFISTRDGRAIDESHLLKRLEQEIHRRLAPTQEIEVTARAGS